MELSKIDKNFEIKTPIDEPDVKWYSVLEEPFDIYGLYKTKEDGVFRRMPLEVAENIHSSTTGEKNVGIANLYKNTSGGRIRFKTDSRYLMLKVEYDRLHLSSHMPEAGVAGFDIHRVEDGKYIYMGIMMPNMDDNNVYYIPSPELFGKWGIDFCSADGIHPNDAGFKLMAERLSIELEKIM